MENNMPDLITPPQDSASGTFRMEKDSVGELQVPAEAYYGIQTQRAVSNFPISGEGMPLEFIHAHAMLKKAAAQANADLGLLPRNFGSAIMQAADEILAGAPWTCGQFPVDIYQTGSGTSTNMNVNEVLASRANEILGAKRGVWSPVHPNDHVNMGQSSNDTVPTSMQVMAAVMVKEKLAPAMLSLRVALERKSNDFWEVVKTGRTHLQDATPIRLGQEFEGYADQILAAETTLIPVSSTGLTNLPIGGTAVGTGLNAHGEFASRVCAVISGWCGIEFGETPYHFFAQATLDTVVRVHCILKSLAVSLTKIANDVRWMGSGPRAGLGEIELPAVQPGSSIMPGKVNPVIAESLLMVCQRVIGNDAALTAAATQCNFELAMSMPLAVKILHESITLLSRGCENFAKCVEGIKATGRGPELVEEGLMLATALVPEVGYERAAEIAKAAGASGRTVREVARERGLSEEKLRILLDAEKMVGK
jgi:fumarate hydratase class II